MGTVVFDFDSTLVPCESLEVALARAPGVSTGHLEQIAAITSAGMTGEIAFAESLARRLEIARPTRAHLVAVGEELARGLTAGADDLVTWLHQAGHEVWIVSGGFQEVLLVVGRALGIPGARIQGVRAEWTAEGAFAGLSDNAFSRSKVDGVRELGAAWSRPAIGVGDGATDLALRDAELVDDFIAYTEHVRRPAVVDAQGVTEVGDMSALREELQERWS